MILLTPSPTPSGRRRVRTLLFIGLSAWLMTGCAGINRLREAQEAFNQSAIEENALRFDSLQRWEQPSLTPVRWSSVRTGYASVVHSLGQIDARDRTRLQADELWGTVLTLKAMAHWRLGQFDPALATAREALDSVPDQVLPRDRALLTALPGLIKTDQAHQSILARSTSLESVTGLLIGDRGAVEDLERGRREVDANHPVQIYLIQAQLAAYRNYMVALDHLDHHRTVAPDDPARVRANSQLAQLNSLFQEAPPDRNGRQVVEYWEKLCALDTL